MCEQECIKYLISKMRMHLPTICFPHSVTKEIEDLFYTEAVLFGHAVLKLPKFRPFG